MINRTRSDQATVIRIRFPRTRHERGAAAVEMAIVMPLLVLMIIGIIDFSRVFNAELQLSQAAREGVRMAALGYPVATAQARAQAAAPNPAWAAPLLASDVTVSPTCLPSPASSLDTAAVIVNYTFTGIGPWFQNKTLQQTAVMRCAG